jgi:hypothetical protein
MPRGPTSIHQVKVTLTRIRPPVWRRIQVASTINLRRLHDVNQATMGWTQSYLYEFEISGVTFSEPKSRQRHSGQEPHAATGIGTVIGRRVSCSHSRPVPRCRRQVRRHMLRGLRSSRRPRNQACHTPGRGYSKSS